MSLVCAARTGGPPVPTFDCALAPFQTTFDIPAPIADRPGGGMADTKVLEAFAARCAGSSPVPGTTEDLLSKEHSIRVIGEYPDSELVGSKVQACDGLGVKIFKFWGIERERW